LSIRSMTGYGRSEFRTPHGPVRVELRTTNHRSLEVSPRLPEDLAPFADAARKAVQARVRRGKVLLTVTAPENVLAAPEPHLDEGLARRYYAILRRLARALGLREKVALEHVLRMPDVVRRSVPGRAVERAWARTRRALAGALADLDRSRLREGALLARDMLRRGAVVRRRLGLIEKRVPRVVRSFGAKTRKRLRAESDPAAAKERLQAETAAFAKACDVTEEVVRLAGHVDALAHALRTGGEVGRKIDFICQEMTREANTLGAKSNDYAIAEHVIDIKTEIDRIREQGQNVE
jgi:uncharacterized protein (TIGR00255 family)